MFKVKQFLYLLQICILISLMALIQRIDAKDPQALPKTKPKIIKSSSNPNTINKPNSKPKSCDAESKCTVNVDTLPVCLLDEVAGCIRKYASECHLKIAACKAGKTYTDYKNDYCAMESFLCEEGYERWTIFFGYEKI